PARPMLRRRRQQIEDVAVVRAMRWPRRPAAVASRLRRRECLVVALPQRQPAGDRRLGILELCVEERRRQLARQERAADIDPVVLRDLAALELDAVGALFPDDLGALEQVLAIDDQGAALAGDDVLGLVEAEGRHRALPAERL